MAQGTNAPSSVIKDELVLAALEHYRHARSVELPDTGSLRADLIALLAAISEARATFTAVW